MALRLARDADGTHVLFQQKPKWHGENNNWYTTQEWADYVILLDSGEYPSVKPGDCINVSLVVTGD